MIAVNREVAGRGDERPARTVREFLGSRRARSARPELGSRGLTECRGARCTAGATRCGPSSCGWSEAAPSHRRRRGRRDRRRLDRRGRRTGSSQGSETIRRRKRRRIAMSSLQELHTTLLCAGCTLPAPVGAARTIRVGRRRARLEVPRRNSGCRRGHPRDPNCGFAHDREPRRLATNSQTVAANGPAARNQHR